MPKKKYRSTCCLRRDLWAALQQGFIPKYLHKKKPTIICLDDEFVLLEEIKIVELMTTYPEEYITRK